MSEKQFADLDKLWSALFAKFSAANDGERDAIILALKTFVQKTQHIGSQTRTA